MNLYIWGDQGRVSYGAEMIVVMARNLREARKAAEKCADWSFGREHTGPTSQTKLGKPDRVIRNKPHGVYFMCAE